MGCLTPGEGIRGYESSLVANALRAQIEVVRRLREPMCCSSGRESDVGGFFVRFLVVLSLRFMGGAGGRSGPRPFQCPWHVCAFLWLCNVAIGTGRWWFREQLRNRIVTSVGRSHVSNENGVDRSGISIPL